MQNKVEKKKLGKRRAAPNFWAATETRSEFQSLAFYGIHKGFPSNNY